MFDIYDHLNLVLKFTRVIYAALKLVKKLKHLNVLTDLVSKV